MAAISLAGNGAALGYFPTLRVRPTRRFPFILPARSSIRKKGVAKITLTQELLLQD